MTPAMQRGDHGIEQRHAALACSERGRRHSLDRERMPGELAADILLQHQHAIDALRNGLRNLAAFDGEARGLPLRLQGLLRGVVDQRVVIRKERRRADGIAAQILRAQGQRDCLGIAAEGRAPRRWLRQLAACRFEGRIGLLWRARL